MEKTDQDWGKALDAYSPSQMAERIEAAGVAKTNLSLVQTVTLAILAGAFIAFGAMLYTLVMTGADPASGLDRLIGGIAFALGLVLVVIAGAELFTGNNLIVIARADGRITSGALLRNWTLVYLGNFIGAVALVLLADQAGVPDLLGGAVGATAAGIAKAKLALPLERAFVSGILCNILVCLAVWMCAAAHHVAGKVLCIVFPISAFVALGFEHSVANMYLIPAGMLAGHPFDLNGFIGNLAAVTAGNIVGGGVLVAAVYWLVYRRAA